MKAAIHTDTLRLDITDVEPPRITDYDHALIRVGAVGFCGSDKHDLDHPPQRPQTPGHEFSGTIEQLGNEPAGFAVGDRVLVRPRSRCGKCDECLKRPRGACENPGIYGCRGVQHPPGAMAELVLVRTENLTKIPHDISFEEATFVDPLAVAIHAVNLGPEVRQRACVVMGAGVIGLLLAQVLALKGAKPVVLVDILQSHLDTAAGLGDFILLHAGDRAALTGELKPVRSGIYYELAGGESPTLDIAIECIEPGGSIMLISQRPRGVWLNYQSVMGKGLTLRGVSGTSDESWQEATELIFERKVKTLPIITHRYPLEQATDALVTAVQGDSLKVILKPNGDVK